VRRLFDFRSVPRPVRALILANMLFWSVISYLLISHFALEAGEVVGISMEPTLQDGDRYIVNRWIYLWRDPRHGEIVALRMPGEEDLTVKRVLALPGELVQFKRGSVLVNGRPLKERYLAPSVSTYGQGLSDKPFKVADGCYFVLGDNRSASEDSRVFGAINRDSIVGLIGVKEDRK
jgi:signal peptidase I